MVKPVFLSDAFYRAHAAHPEIEQKRGRPYICIVIELRGTLFASPMRSSIRHPHVLWTDKRNRCGVDSSKTVVIANPKLEIDDAQPHIRENEFDALRGKEYLLKMGLSKYIREYKKAKMAPDILRNKRLLQYSTLQYFERYL